MKKISLQQIADELNISRITVSKVINGKAGVSEETQRKVAKKLVEYNYKKLDKSIFDLAKDSADGYPENQKNIAVVATEPDFSDFWLKIINGIANEMAFRNYNFVYNFITRQEEHQFSLPQSIRSKSVCGAIIINVYDDEAITALSESGIPTVFLDITPTKYTEGVKGDVLLLEGEHTIYKITDSIIRKGRKEIGFIGDITYCKTIADRFRGFEKACMMHNIVVNMDYCLTSSYRGHFYYPDELQRFLKELETFPEAFVCANDVIAYTLIGYLRDHGYRVPEDIAVSGYDNIKASILSDSELTTAAIDTVDLGKRLARQLIMKIENFRTFDEIVTVKPTILYRRSTDF